MMTRRVIGVVFALAVSAHAHAFKCDSGIVKIGDNKRDVLEKCGQPAHDHGDKWYYDVGSDFFVREVFFVDYKVWRMSTAHLGT